VPGDKSISHRALLFNALAGGRARVRGLLDSEDVAATQAAVRALGARITADGDAIWVEREGPLVTDVGRVDCGNSGTTMRLLAGALAGQGVRAVLDGDASLRRRPMDRVAAPLRQMGADVALTNGRFAPMTLVSGVTTPIRYDSPIASAQVKSCVLLAGLRCGASVREPSLSRDHTERLLERMGATLRRDERGWIELSAGATLHAVDVDVPRDISAAAFWLVAATITPGSRVLLPGVGVNPTRTGVLDALRAMGAQIAHENERVEAGEPVADLTVTAHALRGAHLGGDLALRALDELPVLAVAAACAHGETVISDASELRVKESDRIGRVVAGLRAIGVQVEERADGMVIQGSAGRPLGGAGVALVDASGDHRIAMAFAVAALAGAQVELLGSESISSSYPAFARHLESLCQG